MTEFLGRSRKCVSGMVFGHMQGRSKALPRGAARVAGLLFSSDAV